MKLYRVTGAARYLDLARYFVDERGRQPHYFDLEAEARGENPRAFWAGSYAYNQSHLPVREQGEVVGHAVRAMYLYSAMADLAGALDDASLRRAGERLWDNVCTRRMYITGGIGPLRTNEGFTVDYDLPNLSAYAETCAAIGLVLWNARLLQLDCDGRYADVLERALYNGVLAGVSLDGRAFFYENPLASLGTHHRQAWFDCACCPPNLARLLASLGQYVYGQSATDAVVHLYIGGSGRFHFDGAEVTLRQTTRYPWEGAVRIDLDLAQPAHFGLRLRIPGWCRQAGLRLNGAAVPLDGRVERGYLRLAREWHPGDTLELDLPMPVERLHSHPDVRQNAGCVALQRGPLVYCLEQTDQAVPLHRLALPATAALQAGFASDLLGGIVTITGTALAADAADWRGTLYRPVPPRQVTAPFTAIPYYAWDNRAPGSMQVWIPEVLA